MNRRVVITGIGPVTSIGIGAETFFANLFHGAAEVKEIELNVPFRHRSSHYIPLPEFDFQEYGFKKYYNFIQAEDKMAVIGAKLALIDAGFEQSGDKQNFAGAENSAVVLGTGFSGMETAFLSYLSHMGIEYVSKRTGKKATYNRMIIPLLMSSSPASWVSILLGIKGESFTLNTACASGTYAIGEAFRKIKFGLTDTVVTGGVENLRDENFAIFRGFDSLGALTTSDDSQAFSNNRSGFLFAEGGGCILVLEELEKAKSRNARIYAEVLDYHANSDAHNIVKLEPSGDSIATLLKKLKSDNHIDYLNSHGTGTIPNDNIEAKVIKDVFGDSDSQPYINSTKSIIGHTIGASGAIETAVTAMSIYNGKLHPNKITDPIENLNLVTKALEKPVEKAITVSYGFGGHNSGILLGRYNE